MTNVINLRTARKRARRRQRKLHADANRAVHGQPARERKLDEARREQAHRVLDQHRIDTGGER